MEKIMFSLYPHSIPRCQHIKVNGTQCGSPALRRHRLCYFHKSWQQTRIELGANRARRATAVFDLPMLEDANSIQVALMQVMRLILSGQIDAKNAGLLLYALQTASTNLARTNFEPTIKTRVVIDPRAVAQTPLGEDPWRREDYRRRGVRRSRQSKRKRRSCSRRRRIPRRRNPPDPSRSRNPESKATGCPAPCVLCKGRERPQKSGFGSSSASALHEKPRKRFTPRMGAMNSPP